MSKLFHWALALASVVAVPSSAMAIEGDKLHDAFILQPGAPPISDGTLRFDDINQFSLVLTPTFDFEACSYFVKWISPATAVSPVSPLVSATAIYLDERMAQGTYDCFANLTTPLATMVTLTPGFPSRGYDKFWLQRPVCNLLLGESGIEGDALQGIISFNPMQSPYGFRLVPRKL
jgi:hypothetical protein